ncbi:hypothetical protein ES703_27074 [subsurface metagenome]
MKKLILAIAIAVILLATMSGVASAADITKSTGGGWFYDGLGNRVTFGFNAHIDEVLKAEGEFQLVAHGAPGIDDDMVVHGSFTSGSVIVPDVLEYYQGTCSVNGVEGYEIAVYVGDGDNAVLSSEDWIVVLVTGDFEWYFWWNYLKGGNIKIH